MNANTKTNSQVKVNASEVAERTTIALFGTASILIGLWAVACFAGALLSAGPVGLLKGYLAAVTGI
jgi:hypothetical protein